MPAGYAQLPSGFVIESQAGAAIDIAHLFVTDATELEAQLVRLRSKLKRSAAVWVSWPWPRRSKVATTVSEDVIRAVALRLGFVDSKVCAVDAVWSGLKLVIRKGLR